MWAHVNQSSSAYSCQSCMQGCAGRSLAAVAGAVPCMSHPSRGIAAPIELQWFGPLLLPGSPTWLCAWESWPLFPLPQPSAGG